MNTPYKTSLMMLETFLFQVEKKTLQSTLEKTFVFTYESNAVLINSGSFLYVVKVEKESSFTVTLFSSIQNCYDATVYK